MKVMNTQEFKCKKENWKKFKKNCRRAGSSTDRELQKFITKFNQAYKEEDDLKKPNIDSQIRESLGVQEEVKDQEEAFEYVIKTK